MFIVSLSLSSVNANASTDMSTSPSETTEAKYHLATPDVVVGHEPDGLFRNDSAGASLLSPGAKRGHKCCGGCCDVRRAVIVVNLVNIGILMTILILFLSAIFVILSIPYDDDQTSASRDALYINSTFWVVTVTLVLCILVSAIGVVGAVKLNKWMVGGMAIAYCAGVVMGIVFKQPKVVIYCAFFAYPHFFLVKEIQQGIMTKHNYDATERMSCCCV